MNDPDDLVYKGYYFYYRPHPALYGNWEGYDGDDLENTESKFIGRFSTKADCRKWAKEPIKYKHLKYPQ